MNENELIMILCIICIILQASVNIYLTLQIRKWTNGYNYVLKRWRQTEEDLNELKKKLIENNAETAVNTYATNDIKNNI